MGVNNFNRFLDPPTFGDDILNDENFFAAIHLEAAPQDQFAVLLLRKNKTQAKLPRHFLTDDQAADRGRDHGHGTEMAGFCCQCRAEFFDDGHLLQGEGALKELAAVQSAAENEMPFEQRAAVAENLENFILRHGWSFEG